MVISPATTTRPVQGEGFAGDAGVGVVLQAGIEDGVGDLVGDLVGVTLGHGLTGEEEAISIVGQSV